MDCRLYTFIPVKEKEGWDAPKDGPADSLTSLILSCRLEQRFDGDLTDVRLKDFEAVKAAS